jgi:hypothetical protein
MQSGGSNRRSEELIASVFRVEEYAKQETSVKQAAIRAGASVDIHQTSSRYAPEDRKLHRLRVSERQRFRKIA